MENTKEHLRKKYREIRKNVVDKEKKDNTIYSNVIDNPMICHAPLILLYYSKKEEVNTIPLIEYFLSVGKIVALPKTQENTIEFYEIKDSKDIKLGKYNIFEPTSDKKVFDFSNSVCIVPGICFDTSNFRVGYGGGYYDRFLRHYRGYSIGLTYRECLVEKIGINSYDQKVNLVITD